jgi:AraC-like DNA-binding protein
LLKLHFRILCCAPFRLPLRTIVRRHAHRTSIQFGFEEVRMNEGTPEFPPIRFSTRELPERERLSRRREEFGRRMLRVDIEPVSNLTFHAEAKLRALPGLRTVESFGSAAWFDRTPVMAAEGDDSVGLVINLGKRATASQRGRDVVLGAGDAVPILTHEPSMLTGTHLLGVVVPRAALASRLGSHVDDADMRVIPRRTESLRLLTSYMSLVHDKLVLGTPKLRDMVVSHVHDLMALALTPHLAASEAASSALAHARLNAALNHIAAHFQEPGLSVATVAREQGISPRYLQRLIETTGTTFTARVTELRLQCAFALLTEARDDARRISDIALQAGFSDISHFNRLFRTRFGDTPSGILAQQVSAA